MNHHGKLLREKMKQQGFDIQGLADVLEQHRVTVEQDLKKEQITQKVLSKYKRVLDLDIEDFYPSTGDSKKQTASAGADSRLIDVLYQLVREKDERIKLLEGQLRFFPSAVQMA